MTLYVVATPIGNLGDLGKRALEVLAGVDAILAEDTRHARKLLDHFGIQKPLTSYHDHTRDQARDRLVARLLAGDSLALVSDAGTPCISDPGYRLVRQAQDSGVTVVPVPGPSAVIAFLSASGLPTDRFRFVGFAPRKKGEREGAVGRWLASRETTVLFEGPSRLIALLEELAAQDAEREVALGRELTKLHEEIVRAPVKTLLTLVADRDRIRGEIVLGISPAVQGEGVLPEDDATREWLESLAGSSLPVREAATLASRHLPLTSKEAYGRLLALRSGS